MSLVQRTTDTGIEFVDNGGNAVAGIKNDGTIWGKEAPVPAAVAPSAPAVAPSPVAPAYEKQGVTITPPTDLPSNITATKALINVLRDAGITE